MSHRVLLVDDDEAVARSLARGLEAIGGYEVRVETRGARALAAAGGFEPDLIVLDIVMPDVDGSEVAALLASDPRLARIPVVIMTGLVGRDEVDPATRDSAGRRLLAKPIEPTELVEIARELLGG